MAAEAPQIRVIADETLWDFNDYMQYFHGFPYQRVGIDIFPLDYIPRQRELEETNKKLFFQGTDILEHWDILYQTGQLEHKLTEYAEVCKVNINGGKRLKKFHMEINRCNCVIMLCTRIGLCDKLYVLAYNGSLHNEKGMV